MTSLIVLGLQWGDEGKGKIVDYLAEKVDAVARFQGGHNAGHTIVINNEKTVLHLLPSGILHLNTECFLGNGVVVSLQNLHDEIQKSEARGLNIHSRLKISAACPLLFSCHQLLDLAREDKQADKAIGTTGRGIGPAYEDKIARRALRLSDLLDVNYFTKRLKDLFAYHNFMLREYYQYQEANVQQELDITLSLREEMLSMMDNVSLRLMQLRAENKLILYEGAQGTMLDIDYGTYPFVTSSNTVAGGVTTGAGIAPSSIDYVLGVAKAYTTRVGNGPFPTELHDETAEKLASKGKEFGATTGRSRRCGWLDAVALRYAVNVNGVNGLAITKLDVLDGLESINVAVSYVDTDGNKSYYDANSCNRYSAEYETFSGWSGSVRDIKKYSNLPQEAQQYIEFIEDFTGVSVDIISVGPERSGNIIRKEHF